MRVLMVMEPGIDGVFRHVEGLVHFCLKRSVEVHLAYSDRRGSPQLTTLIEKVGIAGGSCLNLRVGNAPELQDLPAFIRLLQFAQKVRPDVIHAHSSKAGALARGLRCAGVRTALFYTPHAYYGLAPRPSRIVRLFYNTIERLLGRIGNTINISRDEATFARNALGIPPGRISIIHNPVDTDIFRPPSREAQRLARTAFGLSQEGVVLGAIGRLAFQKDPQSLYRAVAAAMATYPELRLWHVGSGVLAWELQQLARDLGIADRIHRTDYLGEPRVFYEAIDALAVTSRYEAGWPIVLLEALSCNLPVIVREAPGTSDIGAAGLSHCWPAPNGDVVAFGNAIDRWMVDRAERRVPNHREIARVRFDIKYCYGSILELYRKALP